MLLLTPMMSWCLTAMFLKEYLRLHRHGVLSADDFNAIRLNGLGMRESVC